MFCRRASPGSRAAGTPWPWCWSLAGKPLRGEQTSGSTIEPPSLLLLDHRLCLSLGFKKRASLLARLELLTFRLNSLTDALQPSAGPARGQEGSTLLNRRRSDRSEGGATQGWNRRSLISSIFQVHKLACTRNGKIPHFDVWK